MRHLVLVIGLALGLHAAPSAAQDKPVAVYFAPGEAAVSDAAMVILDRAAEQYRTGGMAQVNLSGHTDRVGAAETNVGLSQRRANAVRSYLASVGVPEGSMLTMAFGESRPAVDTADGVREPANNRVEIVFSAGSGW